MSTDTLEPAIRRGGVLGGASDGWVMAKRNLIKIKRVPDILVFVLISPIMFVLLFGYVFGSGMVVPGGGDYRDFLMPGIFAMTMAFGIGNTMTVVATDIERGVMDRFRSLSKSASTRASARWPPLTGATRVRPALSPSSPTSPVATAARTR